MRQRSLGALLAVLFAAASAHAIVSNSDGRGPATGIADGYAIVILADPPLADAPGVAHLKNGKIDFNNAANGKYQSALAHARNDFKQWLKATNSPVKVLREYDTVLNGFGVKLNGASFDSLRAGPGVVSVEPGLTYALSMNRSVGVINAPAAWSALGGVANAGAGMKIGVIDTGIDQTHPFLTDNSLNPPAGFPKFDPGNQQFTSRKVIVARVYFTGKPGSFTAQALQDHGTHVSGTIAGINGSKDQLTVASDRAAKAGVVVAIAAGNSGPGVNTVESPGQAADAITACASTNNHYFGIPVTIGTTTYGAAVGSFGRFSPAVSKPLANWSNPADSAGATRACVGVTGQSFSGSIVVLDRGTCTFSTKIRNAQNAGAAGVLVVNNGAGDPIAMGQDGTPNQPTISAVMVALSDRSAIRG